MRHFNKFKSHLNVTNKIRLPVWKMNQPYARVNQPYATLTLASALREMFGVQLYKNNARALLSRILSILNLDWLQHARSVRGVYEFYFITLPPLKLSHRKYRLVIIYKT